MTYAQALTNAADKRKELNAVLGRSDATTAEIIRARGRYIAALQAQIKASKAGGYSFTAAEAELKRQLLLHRNVLRQANKENKKGNYSMIKEFGLGFKSLVNSIKYASKASTKAEKKQATKDVLHSLGTNVKNIVKAPITITTKLLSTGLVATVLFAPISLGMGILHAAWTCLDSSPSPYEDTGVQKMSAGFQKAMAKLNSKVKGI